ncbi:PAS domain-containing hybrid sensor histidine kinase/response regulator [Lutibacter sp. B1]|uniref:PAS domain-containing hybrid sensor histidine kinase/response regulator n=1 Tax=Lutibacter sp. B1 TaxID=2725996 RepID=UPI0014576890|nr:PAS domain-containing hybrid sensor histidine kinase/response regulator [Lutibacter sp. B1]NLP56653.1 PAS domain S-box protein [Lutibacter sp. B1]
MKNKTDFKKLNASESLLNEVNLIVLSCDIKGNITYISPATEKIIGYKPESLLGEGWWDLTFFSIDDKGLFKNNILNIVTGKTEVNPKPYDRKLLCKDGSLKWIEWRDSITVDKTYISVGVDITEWKKTEEIKIQSDTILENVESIVLVSDIDGKVLYASPSVEKMIGYSKDEIMGDKWWKVTYSSPYDASRVKEAIYKYVFLNEKGFVDIFKQKIKTTNGNYKWIEWQISKGVNETYISIGTDITNRILTDIELQKAKESAEESLKVKNEFLANMSHEIRTPLNAVIGFTDLLLETGLTSEQKQYVETMRNSGEILLSLINNVLDLSKLESSKLEVENIPFNLHNRLHEVVSLMKIKAKEKNISLDLIIEPETPDQVISDPTKIGQILLNLIGNAVKFTNEGSVTVTVKQLNQNLDISTIYFEIKDTGIGIVSNKINTVFGAFTQAKSDTSRIYGGTGLGLTIVKKLVNLLKGEIKVSSIFGEGSVFKLTLPLKLGKENQIPSLNFEQENSIEQSLGLNVLLVEDNKTNQLLAKTRLERWDCKVDIANNGIEGVKMTQKKMYDIILMDVQMPVMDGYEATKIIKNDISEKVSKIPVIAMTAYTSSTDIKRVLNVGMNDYIFKPFKPVELYSILKKYGNNTAVIEEEYKKNEEKNDINKITKFIDLHFLRKETLNETSILKLLIELFIKDINEYLKTLDEDFKTKNWKKLFEATHKIKPSISMFGISKLEPTIHLLDNRFRNETQLEDIETHINLCKEILSKVKKELSAELKSISDD